MIEKPTTVEVGGWWVTPYFNAPSRIERIERAGVHGFAVHCDGHGITSCAYLLANGTYLGNGENPAPSDKMVETLAKHYTHVRYGMHSVLRDEEQAWIRRGVLRCLTQWESILLPTHGDIAILSLYRILRARGEW